jgi:hypothetical protein
LPISSAFTAAASVALLRERGGELGGDALARRARHVARPEQAEQPGRNKRNA